MTDMATSALQTHAKRRGSSRLKRLTAVLTSTVALSLNLWLAPAQADPFRSGSPRPIGNKTEAAFKALFEQGNYKQASQLLKAAEPNEPLSYAMRASLAYIDHDWSTMGESARLTRETAERLVQTDPLRGHIYIAAGHFLEGAYTLSTQGTVQATPTVLAKLQQVFSNLSEAEKIDANDPELNLIKGYMDLMLAVNLPFANPQQAIERLRSHASPSYLVYRGIAIAYRDLNQQTQALDAVNQALQQTPANPDLLYLKAQILRKQGKGQESLQFFQQALAKRDQLPRNLTNQIAWEQCRTNNQFNNQNRDCAPLLRQQ